MTTPLTALDPHRNSAVNASAGTGKTWLLVSRMLRLLLDDQSPARILAITFTRKAAAEMHSRLLERMHEWALLADDTLRLALEAIGLKPSEALLLKARCLYEVTLHSPWSTRVLTFHAFCQELLARFPLEAEIPGDFTLVEQASPLQEEAWALLLGALNNKQDDAREQFDVLLSLTSQLENLKKLLFKFLDARLDWWAYTQDQSDPLGYAQDRYIELLGIDSPLASDTAEILGSLLSAEFLSLIEELRLRLPSQHSKTLDEQIDQLSRALDPTLIPMPRFAHLQQAFFFDNGNPRKLSATALRNLLPKERDPCSALYTRCSGRIQQAQTTLDKALCLQLSKAWYHLGELLLQHFQHLKRQRRQLDFNDLEWQAYRLLNRNEQAQWIQYKLDQRIDHILVDEFQDTNSTQWRLLWPLLQELAAGDPTRSRSVFIVGDPKQSIYQFRRANPDLFDSATDWLKQALKATTPTLTDSRRSSPVILDAVNRVFQSEPFNELFPSFPEQKAAHENLWGEVRFLPLALREAKAPALKSMPFRNSLREARPEFSEQRFVQEAEQIADLIQTWIAERRPVLEQNKIRALSYSDVLILFRKRTHAHWFEQIFTERGLPFVGMVRGGLLRCLEIQDLCALLEILVNPLDDIKLAQVLRCPLFNARDEDLLNMANLAADSGYQRLKQWSLDEAAQNTPVGAAWNTLEEWRDLAGRLPLHDFLDRLFHREQLIMRYCQAFPEALHARIRANFAGFIDLALELDSGRYPSIRRFLSRLKSLKASAQDAPDTPSLAHRERMQLMTIHAAKGLESPVVILADSANALEEKGESYVVLNDWPAALDRPRYFLVAPRSSTHLPPLQRLMDAHTRVVQRENCNLLYVAMTRAKQYLVISGSEPHRSGAHWYQLLGEALKDMVTDEQGNRVLSFGTWPIVPAKEVTPAVTITTDVASAPEKPRTIIKSESSITPSSTALSSHVDEDSQRRGLTLHRILELLTENAQLDFETLLYYVLKDSSLLKSQETIEECWQEAHALINNPKFRHYFDPAEFDEAFNELPISYFAKQQRVSGIIDRLVFKDKDAYLIDYKSHRIGADGLAALATQYETQLRYYARGLKQLYPEKCITPVLLFTYSAVAIKLMPEI